MNNQEANEVFKRLWQAAEGQGKGIYEEILHEHRQRLTQDRERVEGSFAARRRLTERIGLPAVRAHRLAQIEQEEREWHTQFAKASETCPELIPLLLIRIERPEQQ